MHFSDRYFLEAFILKERLVVLYCQNLSTYLSYQFSSAGSVGRLTTFLKVFCIHLYSFQLLQRDLVLRSRIVSIGSFLESKLLIQCIELTYFFTNDPKSVLLLVFLSAWGCIYRLRFRTRIHILDCSYWQAHCTRITCNDVSRVLKFELVS